MFTIERLSETSNLKFMIHYYNVILLSLECSFVVYASSIKLVTNFILSGKE